MAEIAQPLPDDADLRVCEVPGEPGEGCQGYFPKKSKKGRCAKCSIILAIQDEGKRAEIMVRSKKLHVLLYYLLTADIRGGPNAETAVSVVAI